MLQISYRDCGLRACLITYGGHSASRISGAEVAVITYLLDIEVGQWRECLCHGEAALVVRVRVQRLDV